MPGGYGIAFIVHSYLHLLCSYFLRGFFFGTWLYDIKYSYLIQIICTHLTHRWTLPSTSTPGQSRPWNNGNEGVHHTSQISKIGTTPLDEV